MLKRLRSKALRLEIGSGALSVRSPEELEAALGAKTGVSSLRIAHFGDLTDDDLGREHDALASMEQRIVHVLSQPPGAEADVEHFVRELDLAQISDDQDWRGIFAALKRLDAGYRDYKRATLLKYLGYLASGRELVRALRAGRPGAGRALADTEARTRQRLLFSAVLAEASGVPGLEPDDLAPLPKGSPCAVDMTQGQSLPLALGRYPFHLVAGDVYLLVDDTGHDQRLPPARCIVGRSVHCDLTVDSAYRGISRRHLVIERTGAGVVLTDISSGGTAVPRGYVVSKLH